MAAPGAWASALGAAILGGNNAYQATSQRDFENKRQKEQDARAAQMQDAQMQIMALQRAIAQHTVTDLPKQDAARDAADILKLSPEAAYDNPAFINARSQAGLPVETNPLVGNKNLESMLSMISDKPGEVRSQAANAAGVAPRTGAVLPPELLFARKERERQGTKDDAIVNWLKNFAKPAGAPAPTSQGPVPPADTSAAPSAAPSSSPGGAPLADAAPLGGISAPGGATIVPNLPTPSTDKGPPFYDPEAERNFTMRSLSGIPGAPLQESDEHKLWMERAKLVDKATIRPPGAAIEREIAAYKKARIVIPQLEEALTNQVLHKNDPTGQKAGTFEMMGQVARSKIRGWKYDAGFPLSDNDALAQQLAGQLKVIAASPYMTNSRSQKMFEEIAVHIGDRRAAPEAQLQKLNELKLLFPQFESEMGFKFVPPRSQGGNTPPPPKAGATPPPPSPGASPASAAPLQYKRGDTIPFEDFQNVLKGSGQNPAQLATALQQMGVNVAPAPGASAAPAPAFKEQPQPWASPAEDNPPAAPPIPPNEPPVARLAEPPPVMPTKFEEQLAPPMPPMASASPAGPPPLAEPAPRSGPYPPPVTVNPPTPAPNPMDLQRELEQVKKDYATHGSKVEWLRQHLKWLLDQLQEQVAPQTR